MTCGVAGAVNSFSRIRLKCSTVGHGPRVHREKGHRICPGENCCRGLGAEKECRANVSCCAQRGLETAREAQTSAPTEVSTAAPRTATGDQRWRMGEAKREGPGNVQ